MLVLTYPFHCASALSFAAEATVWCGAVLVLSPWLGHWTLLVGTIFAWCVRVGIGTYKTSYQ